MLDEVLRGLLHSSITVLIHGLATMFITSRARKGNFLHGDAPLWLDFARVAFVVAIVFIATLVESAWWAMNYVHLGAIETFEEAMYFSTVTYTTLGYGDITLVVQWRVLSAFQAANGVIIAGWSTALVFAVVQQIYNSRHSDG